MNELRFNVRQISKYMQVSEVTVKKWMLQESMGNMNIPNMILMAVKSGVDMHRIPSMPPEYFFKQVCSMMDHLGFGQGGLEKEMDKLKKALRDVKKLDSYVKGQGVNGVQLEIDKLKRKIKAQEELVLIERQEQAEDVMLAKAYDRGGKSKG